MGWGFPVAVSGRKSAAKTKGICWLPQKLQGRPREQRALGSLTFLIDVMTNVRAPTTVYLITPADPLGVPGHGNPYITALQRRLALIVLQQRN